MKLKSFVPEFKGIYARKKLEIYERLKDNPLARKFFDWCENIEIVTKDYGKIRFSPNIWTLLQWKLVEAFFNPDVESILVTKARQLGGTTICVLLDLFSAFAFPNFKGIIVGADYEQILIPISLVREIYRNLPPGLKVRKIEDNRSRICFANGNSINYFYPAKRSTKIGTMGRGIACNYAHFTEVAFMANERDIEVIEASLSTHYPYRKFIYETTPNGYNFWYERWMANKDVPSSRCIFVGWWGREDYRLTKPEEIRYYMKRKVFEWEEEKIKEVKEKYGITLTDAQIAWWRKQAIVKFKKDEASVLSEFPWTEDDAFSSSGKEMFIQNESYDFLFKHKSAPRTTYHIFWGTNWFNMELKQTSGGALKIWKSWEERNPYARYIVGVDPAFSTDPESCNSAIQVIECYADRVEQVAEFAMATIDLQRLALLTLWLAIKYDAIINYEVQGGGQAFMPFLQNVYYLAKSIESDSPMWEEIKKGVLREYIYRRRDSLGTQGAKGVVMTYDLKRRAFATLQSLVDNEQIIIRSAYLLQELQNIVFEAGEFFTRSRSVKTDRLMALLIALIAYQDVQYALMPYAKAMERFEAWKKDREKEEKERIQANFNEYLKAKWILPVLKGRVQ